MDIREICVEEISLEGLDGITLPALWLRLENRNLPLQLTECIKEYLWNFITQHESLECYQILEDRLEPAIFDRFENAGMNSIATATAPDELEILVDVYSCSAVSDTDNKVRGSCSDFNKRRNISDVVSSRKSSLGETLSFFGSRKLIVVASQALREKVILHKSLNPIILSELTDVAYCVLERICRARYQGELQSALNRLNFKEKGLSHIHYIISKLFKLGLVVKNNHTYKRADLGNRTFFQILIHSSRFERDCRDFNTRMLDTIRDIVGRLPDKTITLGELSDQLQVEHRTFKTLYKTLIKSGEAIVQSDTPSKRTRSIRDLKMILLQKPTDTAGEEDEEEDILKMFVSDAEYSIRPLVLEQPFVYQGFQFVLDNGQEGVTQRKVLGFMKGYGRLEARNICKMFNRLNLVNTVLVDQGKQRVQTFYPKNLSLLSFRDKEFMCEKEKMKKLVCEMSEKHNTSSISNINEVETMDCSISDKRLDSKSAMYNQAVSTPDHQQQTKTTVVTLCNDSANESFESNSDSVSDSGRKGLFSSLPFSRLQTPNYCHIKKWDAHLTARKMKRHNIVLEILNDEKIVEGFRDLQKALAKFEEEDGCTTKIDKKTVMRLIDKMNHDGVLQHSIIPITHNERTENFHFVMALDCPVNMLKSAVDQARFKLLGDEENRAAREQQKKNKQLMKIKRKNAKDVDFGFDLNSMAFLGNGNVMMQQFFQPKFKRIRVVHQLLWYLLYGHPDLVDWTSEMEIQDPDEYRIYSDEITWRRFLPPVPIHSHDGLRWLQLGDVATVLPLSVFCQFHRVNYEIENIDEWLEDEERRHTLVRHLPSEIRSLLFFKRKYMFSLMLCIEQLTFMGLITMRRGRSGANCNMPKENMLIYVHKNATILDTRSTTKQHVKVEEKGYERIAFFLNEFANVEAFWFQLQDICVQTNLGFTQFQEPDYDDIKNHIGTAELKKYVNYITQKQPRPCDDGSIPGDNRGAAGLDSSMYSYLYRNWRSKPHIEALGVKNPGDMSLNKRLPKLREKSYSLTPARKKPIEYHGSATDNEILMSPQSQNNSPNLTSDKKTSARVTNLEKVGDETSKPKKAKKPRKAKNLKQAENDSKLVTVDNVGRNERVKGGRGKKRKKPSVELDIPMKKLRMQVKRRSRKKPQTITRGRQRYKYVDEGDLEAIRLRKGRLRVNFTPAEDSILLICHIASTIMTHLFWKKQHEPRKCFTPWSVIRDISQRCLAESFDKTSYSVGRRTLNIMKNPETRICHDITVADVESDKMLLKHFTDLAEGLNSQDPGSPPMREFYNKLVSCLQARFKSQPGIFDTEIPESTTDLMASFIPKTILRKAGDIKKKRSNRFVDKIENNSDITGSIIENMTYIALHMGDEDFSVYQAYRAFESFPDDALSRIFSLMQTSGYVCSKHDMVRRLPFGIRSHRLAQAYLHTFKTVVPPAVIDELSDSITQTSDMKVNISAKAGDIFLIGFLLAKGDIAMDIDMPDQIIVPDVPNMPIFENQFLAMIKESKEEIFKEASNKDSVPPRSLMAAAASMLPSSIGVPDTDSLLNENTESSGATKSKLEKVLRLYDRHPSYTNWLMLISGRNEATDSKFTNLKYSCNSDSVVLSPCTITVENTTELLSMYTKVTKLKGIDEEKELDDLAQNITKKLDSVKLQINESTRNWKLLQESAGEQKNIFKHLFEIFDNARQFGIIRSEVYNKATMYDNIAIEKALKILDENNVIFIVGINEERYVTFNHVHIWMAKGFHFCDRNIKFHDEISREIELLQQTETVSKSKNKDDSSTEVNLTETVDIEMKSKYEEVNFLCRPWHTISGDISYKTTKSLLLSLYLKIVSSPGITPEQLCASYSYQPICILQLLDILTSTGCLISNVIETPGPKRIFGGRSKPITTTYYEATQDGLIILGKWCNFVNKAIEKQINTEPMTQ